MKREKCYVCGVTLEEGDPYFSYEAQRYCESCLDEKIAEFVEALKAESQKTV